MAYPSNALGYSLSPHAVLFRRLYTVVGQRTTTSNDFDDLSSSQ